MLSNNSINFSNVSISDVNDLFYSTDNLGAKRYVDQSGNEFYIFNSKVYKLSDLNDKIIPDYNLDEVANYILLDWANILHELHYKADIDDVNYALENARTYMTTAIHESVVWEVAVSEALYEVTGNEEFKDWENYIEMFISSKDKNIAHYYEVVYDKIAKRVSELSEQYVIKFAKIRQAQLIKAA